MAASETSASREDGTEAIRPHDVDRADIDALLSNEKYLRNGLRDDQVRFRREQGLVNVQKGRYTRTYRSIVRRNLLTPFNLLNFALAGLIIFAAVLDRELIKNLTFLGVVISNLLIGIIQEFRAKRTVDSLSLLTEPQVRVIRDGRAVTIPVDELVTDDLMKLRDGVQIAVDGEFLWGDGFEVDESLLTGESDPVVKRPGDKVSSGSYVVAGEGYCHVSRVGDDTYAAKISSEVSRNKTERSILIRSLSQLIRVISFLIIPIGIALFLTKFIGQPGDFPIIIVSTVSAIIGMIPAGLILLTSVAFANSTVKLGKMHCLVQNLPSIESLARVDVLCLDKTGTITSGELEVMKIIPLSSDRSVPDWSVEAEVREALSHMLAAQPAGNNTQLALAREVEPRMSEAWQVEDRIHFSSRRKWSSVTFEAQGTYYLGAAERLLKDDARRDRDLGELINRHADRGERLLMMAHSVKPLEGSEQHPVLPEDIRPIAIITLADQIRDDAKETFRYFREQGVALRIISGDHPRTVAAVAERVGIEGTERSIDMTSVGPDADYRKLAEDYVIFGRVNPEQKRALLKGLQAGGHFVGMTGDGINDVPALKDADCAIAMADGSEAARSSADIVLLKNNLRHMVDAVGEGRRVANNIERVAPIYLTKTVYSMLLALAFIFIPTPYPVMPLQMSLIASTCIGIPTFFLALRPNRSRLSSGFLKRVLSRALVPGVTAALLVIIAALLSLTFTWDYTILSSVTVYVLAFVSLWVLWHASLPFTGGKRILFLLCCGMLVTAVMLFHGFFDLVFPVGRIAFIYLPLWGAAFAVLYLAENSRAREHISSALDVVVRKFFTRD